MTCLMPSYLKTDKYFGTKEQEHHFRSIRLHRGSQIIGCRKSTGEARGVRSCCDDVKRDTHGSADTIPSHIPESCSPQSLRF